MWKLEEFCYLYCRLCRVGAVAQNEILVSAKKRNAAKVKMNSGERQPR